MFIYTFLIIIRIGQRQSNLTTTQSFSPLAPDFAGRQGYTSIVALALTCTLTTRYQLVILMKPRTAIPLVQAMAIDNLWLDVVPLDDQQVDKGSSSGSDGFPHLPGASSGYGLIFSVVETLEEMGIAESASASSG